MGQKRGERGSPAQLEHSANYIANIFEHVKKDNCILLPISDLIKLLKSKGLNSIDISHLFGCDNSLIPMYENGEKSLPGAKTAASILRRITVAGQHVAIYSGPTFIIDQYKAFYKQFAHGDGKLHDIGLDGSEWTYYEA